MVFQNASECYVFKRRNITIQKSTDSLNLIAVKILNASTECLSKSSDFFTQSFTETTNGSQIIRSEFSYSNGQYRVVYTVSICPNTTDLYTRKVGTTTYQVCEGFRLFSGEKRNFYDAQKLCNSSGGYGLTGPLKGIDYDILKEKGIALRKQNGLNANDFFWIDGIRYTWDKFGFVFEDESHNGLTGYIMHWEDPNDNPPSALYWYGANGGYQTADYGADYSAGIGALCRVNDVPLQD
ncbi:hypothetical protein B9Z55_004237 [Caenorhabditis nigoni]|uniref:C-type lectin domain-containing protein n=1 Tax=Caenorhabditis nigoni TaxID=1611254 RepID=A0A2G5UVZ7_9PELO|nr:hypothetical protein B9Z55_004237 [Caenorhabditis nigoni]